MKTLIIITINIYLLTEPLRKLIYTSIGLPVHACRYNLTCSRYFLDVVKRYGTMHGVRLGIRRLATCHPFSTQNSIHSAHD